MTFEQMPKERDRDGFVRELSVGEAASHFRMTQEIFRYARRTMQIRTERTSVYVSTDLQRATPQSGKLTSHYEMRRKNRLY